MRRNGVEVDQRFRVPQRDRRLVGLVGGLRPGANRIAARAAGAKRAAELTLFNSPDHRAALLGAPPVALHLHDRGRRPRPAAPTPTARLRPRSNTATARPTAASSRSPTRTPGPADLAQTTTRDGRTVDYVVRIESGVINRAIYRWAVLAPGGVTGRGLEPAPRLQLRRRLRRRLPAGQRGDRHGARRPPALARATR